MVSCSVRYAKRDKIGSCRAWEWKLTDGERSCWLRKTHSIILLTIMMNGNRATVDELTEELWPDPDDQPDGAWENIRVHISRLRRELRPYGWTIESIGEKHYGLLSLAVILERGGRAGVLGAKCRGKHHDRWGFPLQTGTASTRH